MSPGAAFAGDARPRHRVPPRLRVTSGLSTPLFAGVKASNDVHRQWARRRLGELLGELPGKTVAVLGLTYKANTDTLRRSESVGLCHWLAERGARVRAHDPAIRERGPELPPSLTLSATVDDAIRAADAVVICHGVAGISRASAERLAAATARPLVLDAGRFLAGNLAGDPRVRYFAVGIPSEGRDPMMLEGKRILITGASEGFGLAVAERCLAEGADVAICARSPERIERAGVALRASAGAEGKTSAWSRRSRMFRIRSR